MNRPQKTRLIEILAVVDALFAPIRDPETPAWRATWERRAEYRRVGLPLRRFAASGDARQRKASAEDLAKLQSDGLIRQLAPRERSVTVRLTAKGDWFARCLAGQPTLAEAMPMLKRLTTPGGRTADGWAPECVLVGVPVDA